MRHFLWLMAPALLLLATAARGEGVGWRGDGTGRYPSAAPPLEWDTDEGKNILWRTEVGKGQSTPVASGDRVFITAEPGLLRALDPKTGKVLWTQDNGYAALPAGATAPQKPPPTSPNCGYASPTPVTDGRFVYASYGTGIVACHDLEGKRQWVQYVDLPPVNPYGRSASPVLAPGKVVVSIGGLAALDRETGKVLWQTTEAKPTYGTPAITRIADVDVALTPNGDCVRLSDGKILASSLAASTYTSPIVSEGVVYWAGPPAIAVRLPAKGADTLKPDKLWETDALEGEVFASPVLEGGLLYCVSNLGVLYVLDAATGKTVYTKELDIPSAGGMAAAETANLYPSLTLAGKHLLLGNDGGRMLVLAPGREYKELARNLLDKGSGATPVPDGKRLFLRGGRKLYCIGQE